MSPSERMKHIRESVGISSIDAAVEFGISISKPSEPNRAEQDPAPLDVACAAAHLYTCKLEDFRALQGGCSTKGRLHIDQRPPSARVHGNADRMSAVF